MSRISNVTYMGFLTDFRMLYKCTQSTYVSYSTEQVQFKCYVQMLFLFYEYLRVRYKKCFLYFRSLMFLWETIKLDCLLKQKITRIMPKSKSYDLFVQGKTTKFISSLTKPSKIKLTLLHIPVRHFSIYCYTNVNLCL